MFLDSNRDDVERWDDQVTWYRETMEAVQADPEITDILVFAHHPPYTNSPIVDGDLSVRSDFVPGFCETDKAVALFSGHAHGYEHFVFGERCGDADKHFVISAGGGGPRPDELRTGSEVEAFDRFEGAAPRPFNYLLVDPRADGLEVVARGLDKGDTMAREIDRFLLH